MGNETELETRIGRKWKTRQAEKHLFTTKTRKTGGEKHQIAGKKLEKAENYKTYRNKILTRKC